MSGQKLPIYPLPDREILVVEQTSALEEHIGVVRRQAQALYADAYTQVHGAVSRWIDIEHSIERRLKSLRAPDEQLNPSLLYIGVAFLSGSVLARGRNIFVRVTLPPALFVAASTHFLPKTTANVRAYAAELEERHAPALAEAHSTGIAHAQMTWARARESIGDGAKATREGTAGIVAKIEEATGLKLGQVLGGGQAMAKKAEVVLAREIEEVTAAAHDKAEAIRKEAEPQVAEAEKKVQPEQSLETKVEKLLQPEPPVEMKTKEPVQEEKRLV